MSTESMNQGKTPHNFVNTDFKRKLNYKETIIFNENEDKEERFPINEISFYSCCKMPVNRTLILLKNNNLKV